MSAADCERWISLSDRAAAGEPLGDREQAWLGQHARSCRDCGREADFYSSLHDAVGRPEMLVVPPAAPHPIRRRSFVGLAMAGTLALAASVAIGWGLASRREHKALIPVVEAPTVTARLILASGGARLGAGQAAAGRPVVHGERLSTDDGFACAAIAGSITVCLDSASAATLALADPKQTMVYLEKGRLLARLDHQPAGRTFLVRTAQAEVQAVGTRFSVRLSEGGQTQVRLHEGRIAVRAANHVASDLAAPAEARVDDEIRVAPLPATASQDDDLLSDLSEIPRTENAATMHLASVPEGADVVVGNVAMGKTPLSMALSTDAHVRLTAAGYVPVSEWISIAAGTTVERTLTLSALPPPVKQQIRRVHHPAPQAPAQSPSTLLAKAQELRARGAYDDCAKIYRRLWSQFPGSEESKVSMISLGELEIGKRHNPAAALEAFNAYLKLGGSLDREARYGRIRALRSLGRDDEAANESASFLRDYPTSIQAASLRVHAHGK